MLVKIIVAVCGGRWAGGVKSVSVRTVGVKSVGATVVEWGTARELLKLFRDKMTMHKGSIDKGSVRRAPLISDPRA